MNSNTSPLPPPPPPTPPPPPSPTPLWDLLFAVLAHLPHDGLRDAFSTGLVLGLSAGLGFLIVVWLVQNLPTVLPF